jgi:hypothetical protein
MPNMTVFEIFEAIEAAAPAEKVALAEELLAAYDGNDRYLIEPEVMSMAILGSQEDGLEPL